MLGKVPNFLKKGAFRKSETTRPTAHCNVQDGSNFQQQSFKDIKSNKVVFIYAS